MTGARAGQPVTGDLADPAVTGPPAGAGSGGGVRYRADAVVTVTDRVRVHRPGVVDVVDGRVVTAGTPHPGSAPPGPERRLSGLLMPGMINTHAHGPMTLFRGAAEDVPLSAFLTEVLWPREAHLSDEDVYWGMTLACAEMLRSGVTTSCEMYYFEQGLLHAVRDSRTRCLITPGVVDIPEWTHLGSWQQRLTAVADFADANAVVDPRVQVGFAAHSAYALPLEALEQTAAAARERDALLHIHVAETREEGADLEREHGRTVPALLADRGVLEGRVLAAHGVHLTDADIALFAEHDVAVAHCPGSNAKLAAGTARLTDLMAAGIRVGLGTDGPASHNDLSLWHEVRLAPLLARLRSGAASTISAAQSVELATAGGARALGYADLGTLAPGSWADMLLVDTDDLAFGPVLSDTDVLAHLVWACTDRQVRAVWVAGEQVVADGACVTVDVDRARAEVQNRAAALAAR